VESDVPGELGSTAAESYKKLTGRYRLLLTQTGSLFFSDSSSWIAF